MENAAPHGLSFVYHVLLMGNKTDHDQMANTLRQKSSYIRKHQPFEPMVTSDNITQMPSVKTDELTEYILQDHKGI